MSDILIYGQIYPLSDKSQDFSSEIQLKAGWTWHSPCFYPFRKMEAQMTLANSLIYDLQQNLWQFGLNPADWQIRFTNLIVFPRTTSSYAVKDIQVVNKEDHNVYFNAEILLEEDNEVLKVQWQEFQMLAI
jgi:hypothetical protein